MNIVSSPQRHRGHGGHGGKLFFHFREIPKMKNIPSDVV
ncbi:hypothetical protein D3OALGA1CA_2750 [Olavius algarvensis associated proteobacterium Delta 3]|nr:hypothetical protein D3OALGA1CA_2750 [Olavius algarvensis associated proteobacterium Delta 3]